MATEEEHATTRDPVAEAEARLDAEAGGERVGAGGGARAPRRSEARAGRVRLVWHRRLAAWYCVWSSGLISFSVLVVVWRCFGKSRKADSMSGM